MSGRTVVVVILALVFGVSAALLVGVMLRNPGTAAPTDKVTIVVAKINILPGVQLQPAMLESKPYPKDMVPTDSFTDIKELTGRENQRSTMMTIYKGEPVVKAKVTEPGQTGLSGMIPPGHRAFSIPVVDQSAGVGGFILPRNHVDILLTLRSQQSRTDDDDNTLDDGGASTTTLLQNVEILAVGNVLDPMGGGSDKDKEKFRTVTMAVTPDQAAKLQLGSTQGVLHLALRSPDDKENATPEVATLKNIRGLQMEHVEPAGDEIFAMKMQELEKRLLEEQSEERRQMENRIRQLEQANQLADGVLDVPGVEDAQEVDFVRVHTLRGRHRGQVLIRVPGEEKEGTN